MHHMLTMNQINPVEETFSLMNSYPGSFTSCNNVNMSRWVLTPCCHGDHLILSRSKILIYACRWNFTENSWSFYPFLPTDRKIPVSPGGRWPSPVTSTPTPSVGCVQVSHMRASWSASCVTDAAMSHASISPLPMVLVSRLELCDLLSASHL